MSALYLIERHAEPDTLLYQSRILDVQESTAVMPLLNGRFVVKVPDGIPIEEPTVLGPDQGPFTETLLTQKAQGFLSVYAGFTRMTFDDLLDTTNIDFTNSFGVLAGSRATLDLPPGGVLQSLITVLPGPAPMQVFVTWDTYNFVETDSSTLLPATNLFYIRQYNELPSTPLNVLCQVSFDGGVSFNPITDSTTLNVPPVGQGTNFIMRLTNVSMGRLSIGSWTIIY